MLRTQFLQWLRGSEASFTLNVSPSSEPSSVPSGAPSTTPSSQPSVYPSAEPSVNVSPSSEPSSVPSGAPSTTPSSQPSVSPSAEPSVEPHTSQSSAPSSTRPIVQPVKDEEEEWLASPTWSVPDDVNLERDGFGSRCSRPKRGR
jgi:hypothetical protein